MRYIFFPLFAFLTFSLVQAQHIFSRQFSFGDQIASNEIQNIHQDKEGYIWIATTNGLARYDGYRVVNFRSDYKNPHLLADNAIINIDDNDKYVWIATWGGINLYDKRTCRILPFPDERLKNHSVNYVAIDKTGNAWIGANDKIYKCNSDLKIANEYLLNSSQSEESNNIQSIYVDRENAIWVITLKGIFKYEPAVDNFKCYPFLEIGNSAGTMYQDQKGFYWLGTWGKGLWQFFPDKSGQERYKQCNVQGENGWDFKNATIYSIEQDNQLGYLWVLSHDGLFALKHIDAGELESVDIHNLVDTRMMYTRLCKDREGNLWLGSYDMGYILSFENLNVDNYPLLQLKKNFGWDANILNLSLDHDNVIWFEQDRQGLCLYDLASDKFVDSGVGEVNIITKSLQKLGVWVNSKYTPRVMRLSQDNLNVRIEEEIQVGGVGDLIEDSKGNLWISVWYGHLNVKCPDKEDLVISGEDIPRMSSLASDKEGKIWGISYKKDIYRLECVDNRISCKLYGHVPMLSEKEKINSFCFDSVGHLWLNTSLGRILRADAALKDYKNISFSNALDNCSVLGLIADRHNVWIIANRKVVRYDVASQEYQIYSTTDENVLPKVFRYRAICLDNQGGLFVGGHKGFMHIKNEAVSQDERPVHLYVTDVKVGNESLFFDKEVTKNTIDDLHLSSNDKNIEIFLSPLLYSGQTRFRIAYRLDGLDEDWVVLNKDRNSIFYNSLSQGTYRLHLKYGIDGEDTWADESVVLTIVKEPKFYETWYAYLIYVILLGIVIGGICYLLMWRMKRKAAIKLQEEVTYAKLTYFANVSHELLTPLTIISCIADYFAQKLSGVDQQIVMLRANVDKLKRLLQQILDFRKLDAGKLKLNVSEGNIGEYVKNICQTNFSLLAQRKDVKLTVDVPVDGLIGYVDFDKLDKILHNLLSNAIKYTPSGKHILVKLNVLVEETRRILVLVVQDEGIGIRPGEVENIFTRFYNGGAKGIESNGIGLSLTKDLVTMHHGSITVESKLGQGSCFTVRLPIDKDCYLEDEFINNVDILSDELNEVVEENLVVNDTDRFTILLIDDNTELLLVMEEMLQGCYKVLTATDGKQAMEKLNGDEINVIVCDVMLPDVNGWDFCTQIKSDLRFNHIPVIILTARNGINDRVNSYEAGADGYIAKPFDMKVLKARIDNLGKASRMRQIAFRKEENLNLTTLNYPSADEQFLQSIIESIETHLDDSDYDLQQLSDELHLSRSTLHRKIKSITGMTPLDFIRNIKMKRACMMLLERKMNVSEIAYAIGFTSPKYFSKCFKDEFGVTPSEYLQQKIGN